LPPDTVRGRRKNISNFELEPLVMFEKSIGEGLKMRLIGVAWWRQQRQARRRAAAPTSGLRDGRAPKQTCAMRTGSFHRTISPAQHLAMPARLPAPTLNPSSGSMDKRASTRSSNPPTWPIAIRATSSDHPE
jgi:hypothetical protein